MGNIYSLIDLKQDEDKTKIIQKEILELEQNIKNIDALLQHLNEKCDIIITKIVELDDKTYEMIDTCKTKADLNLNLDVTSDWDYYDLNNNLNKNINLSNTSFKQKLE